MTASLVHIWRHPIKSLGSEALTDVQISPDGAVDGDRAWALLNEAALNLDDWQPRRNFIVVARGPELAQISSRTEASGSVTLSHPDKADLTVSSADDSAALGEWVTSLWPDTAPKPARLVRAPGHGMTDMAEPFVSFGSLTDLRILSQASGVEMDMRRFRINFWIDGLDPWQMHDQIGQKLKLGATELTIVEPIERCRAPEANPATGQRDVNVLRLLEDRYGHRDFGVYARVTQGGQVALGDPLSIA